MSVTAQEVNNLLKKHHSSFADVVPFDPKKDTILNLDFTVNNLAISAEIVNDTQKFSDYIDTVLTQNKSKYGLGGYFEHRTIYSRSQHFGNNTGEARRLHLGVDIWGKVHTKVSAFTDAKVHSFAFNNNFGDYGATIILEHQIEDCVFYSLYGHLSLGSLMGLEENQIIKKGNQFAQFGDIEDNGNWPPHLHFQIMVNMNDKFGDYPGVAKFSEKEFWLSQIPDPNLILRFENGLD
jgi:murein DD-endopeptidase MepM/ murein hydrolase activator NlpD